MRFNIRRSSVINRLALSATFYDVYAELDKNNTTHFFVAERKSDQKEFFVKRIARESREPEYLKHCQSPYTVKFHEYIPPFLVLENLPGGDLLSFINEENFETSEALILIRDVLAALAEVHDRGLVHCDIKPENFVFVEPDCAIDPHRPNFKLVDFGSARPKADTETEFTGTIAYLSPEVLESTSSFSAKSDVYAAGCVAFFLLNRQPLVDPSLPDDEIAAILRDVRFPESKFPEITDEKLGFVKKLVARDPRDRPSAKEALHELGLLIQ